MKTKNLLIILTLWSSIFITGNLFAQGDSPQSCAFCKCKADETCNTNSDCTTGSGCDSLAFTVPCESDYCISCATWCSGSQPCRLCWACATVIEVGVSGTLGICQTIYCGDADCDFNSCEPAGGGSIHLKPGHNYVLYVCLKPCLENDSNCTQCDPTGTCKAVGWVVKPGSSCLSSANCN